jgi:hypothetical protein
MTRGIRPFRIDDRHGREDAAALLRNCRTLIDRLEIASRDPEGVGRHIASGTPMPPFHLTEGVDVYFLANQMGASVKMIEDRDGHITPVKNADRLLQGLPGWEPIEFKRYAGLR